MLAEINDGDSIPPSDGDRLTGLLYKPMLGFQWLILPIEGGRLEKVRLAAFFIRIDCKGDFHLLQVESNVLFLELLRQLAFLRLLNRRLSL